MVGLASFSAGRVSTRRSHEKTARPKTEEVAGLLHELSIEPVHDDDDDGSDTAEGPHVFMLKGPGKENRCGSQRARRASSTGALCNVLQPAALQPRTKPRRVRAFAAFVGVVASSPSRLRWGTTCEHETSCHVDVDGTTIVGMETRRTRRSARRDAASSPTVFDRLSDDLLYAVAELVPSEDLLPTALTCVRMHDACIQRARLERAEGDPLWVTSITTSEQRVHWAVAMGAAPPTSKWCAAVAERGDLVMLKWLRAFGAPWDDDTVAAAAGHGHLEVLKYAHEQGLPLDAPDEDGDQLIHEAAGKGHLAVMKWLHERGVPLDVANGEHAQPIHLAAMEGHLPVIQWLHEHGVALDAADDSGCQPIHDAAVDGHLAVVQWLHERGVPLDAAAVIGGQPIHFAAMHGQLDLVQWLHESGGVTLDAAGDRGRQPIHNATNGGHLALVQWLHERGVPLDAADDTGSQPIHEAAASGHLAVLQWLHKRGVPLDALALDANCQPIHAAAVLGQLAIIQWLYEHGVPLDVRTNNGLQAIDLAAAKGHLAVVEWLRERRVEYS